MVDRFSQLVDSISGLVDGGAEQKTVAVKCDGAFMNVRHSDDPAEVQLFHVHFPEGMHTDLRDELFSLIVESGAAGYAICGAMRAVLQLNLTQDDHTRCATKDPGPAYYMLCDEEELGTHDNGNMDGDLKIRRAAGTWEMLCGVRGSFIAVELLGYEDGELVCGGQVVCDIGPEPFEKVVAAVSADVLRVDPAWAGPSRKFSALVDTAQQR